ncbi:MAG: hypothetical protein MMC33_009554 [Icmadophila ericetorum]|nr:hypothetical protein [Icmadophila ericetorum]
MVTNDHPPFDVLTATCIELQRLLSDGKIRSTDIVDLYLDQIDKHNHRGLKLNAMISIASRDILMSRAQDLDSERSRGVVRSPLHGIPITIKDNICTHPSLGMATTCGSFAFDRAKPKRNAPLVNSLLEAGVIIIGKANLSEFAGWKGLNVTTGWSAKGGQTQSPYVKGGVVPGDKFLGHSTPAGSSSGSAVGVAAGFAPLSLATETDGSITQPSNRAALYGLKATVGGAITECTSPWSPLTDSAGGMAKSTLDLAALFDVIIKGRDTKFGSILTDNWKGQRVGFVNPYLWELNPAVCDRDEVLLSQQRAEIEEAAVKIKNAGAHVEKNVPFPSMDQLVLDGEDALEQLWNHDFGKAWATFLQEFEFEPGAKPIRTVADIVEFNKQHSDKELPKEHPSQKLLEGVLEDKMTATKYDEGVQIIRTAAKVKGIDKVIDEYGLDVIIGPMDGRIPTIAAAAGSPIASVPLGYYTKGNGRPFAMAIVAKAGQEDKIFRAMSAWEALSSTDPALSGRRAPPLLVNEQTS